MGTNLRAAAIQALEALELLARYEHPLTKVQVRKPRDGGPIVTVYPQKVALEAITALRAALAEPEQESDGISWLKRDSGYFTAPTPRKPLSEKEMYAVEEEARKNFRLSQRGPRGQQITYWDGLTPWLIRAVEAAHGITGESK